MLIVSSENLKNRSKSNILIEFEWRSSGNQWKFMKIDRNRSKRQLRCIIIVIITIIIISSSASQLMFRPISVDFHEFSLIFIWSSLEFSQNIRFRWIFRIFRQNYQHSRTRRVEKCIRAHVSMDLHRFAWIRINFRVYDRLKYSKIDRKSTET